MITERENARIDIQGEIEEVVGSENGTETAEHQDVRQDGTTTIGHLEEIEICLKIDEEVEGAGDPKEVTDQIEATEETEEIEMR